MTRNCHFSRFACLSSLVDGFTDLWAGLQIPERAVVAACLNNNGHSSRLRGIDNGPFTQTGNSHAKPKAMKPFALPTASVDAEFILRVLADEHRHQVQFDPEAEPDIELCANSTIADWRNACDLVSWRKLGRALNAEFGIRATDSEWRAVLCPPRRRPLLGVCQFISERAKLPQLVPWGYFGASSLSASAFMGIRVALAEQGIDAPPIRPSTELAHYTGIAPTTFVSFAARVAPGRLPTMQYESRFWRRERRVTFGSLKIFRDFAECLAGVRGFSSP